MGDNGYLSETLPDLGRLQGSGRKDSLFHENRGRGKNLKVWETNKEKKISLGLSSLLMVPLTEMDSDQWSLWPRC